MVSLLHHHGTCDVHLVHIRTRTNFRDREQVEDRLESLCTGVEALGFSARFHIRTGPGASAFIEMAGELAVDYVALYWMPKPLLNQALLGSIDSDILRLSTLPVFVHNHTWFRQIRELGSVLYATDFKFTDSAAMPYLINERFRADTHYLLHVGRRAPDPVTEERRVERVRANLERLGRECAHAYETIELIQTTGFVRSEIIRHARSLKVDLIVVGKSEHQTSGRHGPDHRFHSGKPASQIPLQRVHHSGDLRSSKS
jgi:nucleotide-binding universal stress UspA family protein